MRKYLSANERLVLVAHYHWLVLWRPAAEALAAFVVAYLLAMAGDNLFTQLVWVAAIGFFLRFGWATWLWYEDRIALTDKRLFAVNGIFTREVSSMPLRKVTDMKYRRTLPGRLLGYGEFIVESAGQDQALGRIRYLAEPEHFYQTVTGQVFSGVGGRRRRDNNADPGDD